MNRHQIQACLKDSPLNNIVYKSTGYLLWLPKSKERILDDFKQLSEEDQLWFLGGARKYYEEIAEKEEESEELKQIDIEPVIPLKDIFNSQELTKSQKRRLRFRKRLEKALENPENNSDLSVLVKSASQILKKKAKLKKKASDALVESCDPDKTALEKKLAAAQYFKYSGLVLNQQERYLYRKKQYENAYQKL